MKTFVSKSQNVSQNYQKSIRFIMESLRRFTTLRNVKKALVLEHFEASKKHIKIPYKTCRLLRLWGPFSQNFSGMYKKSFRSFTIPRVGFHTCGKPYKHCGKLMILSPHLPTLGALAAAWSTLRL